MGNQSKKKSGFLKNFLIVVGAIVVLGVIGSMFNDSSTDTSTQSSVTSNESQKHEEFFAEAQELFSEGKYAVAIETIEKAIKAEAKEEYEAFKAEVQAAIETRKTELESNFDINEDKVENIIFISPKSGITKGLVFYPYIGIKDSKKYMLLRVGYQEDVSNAPFVFTDIKVRVGDRLEKLSFNAMDKKRNVDILGTGMTEVVDISVRKDVEELLNLIINHTDEVIVRFEDISNTATDYILTDDQKQSIKNILEYYSYLD